MNRKLLDIVVRSYLVDPERTDQELRALGEERLATELKVDHSMGRLAENYGILTGKKILTVPIDAPAPMFGGARVSTSAEEAG